MYTIKEVEQQTGVSCHTLRFWIKKGLFPFIERDHNQVRYFSQRDVGWVFWIQCLRLTGMSIRNIKHYISLADQGITTAQERREMIVQQHVHVVERIHSLNDIVKVLERKIALYDTIIEQGVDTSNPQAEEYDTQSHNRDTCC